MTSRPDSAALLRSLSSYTDSRLASEVSVANTEHGSRSVAPDAHTLYEGENTLELPSLAWRFFKESW